MVTSNRVFFTQKTIIEGRRHTHVRQRGSTHQSDRSIIRSAMSKTSTTGWRSVSVPVKDGNGLGACMMRKHKATRAPYACSHGKRPRRFVSLRSYLERVGVSHTQYRYCVWDLKSNSLFFPNSLHLHEWWRAATSGSKSNRAREDELRQEGGAGPFWLEQMKKKQKSPTPMRMSQTQELTDGGGPKGTRWLLAAASAETICNSLFPIFFIFRSGSL